MWIVVCKLILGSHFVQSSCLSFMKHVVCFQFLLTHLSSHQSVDGRQSMLHLIPKEVISSHMNCDTNCVPQLDGHIAEVHGVVQTCFNYIPQASVQLLYMVGMKWPHLQLINYHHNSIITVKFGESLMKLTLTVSIESLVLVMWDAAHPLACTLRLCLKARFRPFISPTKSRHVGH